MKTMYVTFDLIEIDGRQLIQDVEYGLTKKQAERIKERGCDNSDYLTMSMTEQEFEYFKNGSVSTIKCVCESQGLLVIGRNYDKKRRWFSTLL